MASYISANVIRFNDNSFVDEVSAAKSGSAHYPTGVGVTKQVPCPDAQSGGVIDGDYWATPVNEGTVSDFTFKPYNVNEVVSSKPTVDSFAVVRISSRFSRDVWWVQGTSTQYLASCAVCCSDSPVAMPVATSLPLQAGCQTLCNFDEDDNYFATLGLPTLTPGVGRYYPFGNFNNAALPAAASTGYANTTTLLTFLNTAVTGWAAVGTWTLEDGTIKVTQTDGPGDEVLCAAIVSINPSA
jgi:hypothetical protein